MQRIVVIDGKNVILGLDWSKVVGDKPAQAAKELAASKKCPLGIFWSVSVDSDVVHSVGLSSLKVKGTVYSGAAAVARADNGVIGVEQLDEDMFWMVVTESGRVLPGYDIIGSAAEINHKIKELAMDVELAFMAQYAEEGVALNFGLEEAKGESPFSLIQRLGINEGMRLKSMAGIPRAALMGGGLVLFGVAAFGYMQYAEHQRQLEFERLLAEEEAAGGFKPIDQEVTVEKIIDRGPTDADILRSARQEEIIWLQEDFNKVNRIPLLREMMDITLSVPLEKNGWVLKEVVYDSRNPSRVGVVWNREWGTPNGLREMMLGRGQTTFAPDFLSAVTMMRSDAGSPNIRDIMEAIKNNSLKHQDFASALIESGVNFTSALTENAERKEVIKGLKNKALETMPQLELTSREFMINGEDYSTFAGALDLIKKADNLLITRISFNPSEMNSMGWRIEGKLYE